jgi:hypothetical protein
MFCWHKIQQLLEVLFGHHQMIGAKPFINAYHATTPIIDDTVDLYYVVGIPLLHNSLHVLFPMIVV